nr:MAG TPA: hypothetical protein [Caudoviricetes sp.]
MDSKKALVHWAESQRQELLRLLQGLQRELRQQQAVLEQSEKQQSMHMQIMNSL